MKEDFDKKYLDRNERKELKANGVNLRDKKAVQAYFEKKQADAKAAAEEEARKLEEQAKADRLANPTTEDLLKQIVQILEKKN